MPNWCEYDMCAVAKNREVLERLIRIMNYKDSEYYIYRVNQATAGDIEQEDDLHTVRIMGFVAWSCGSWFDRIERIDETIESCGHYITLDILCERLGIAVEVFGKEQGMGFQEHYLCNPKGDVIYNECVEWHQTWFDDDGNDLPEPIESGGLEYYDEFDSPSGLYNAI